MRLVVLRDRRSEPGVTNMELFFDLVYVFAVTQLSHALFERLTVRGAVDSLVLFAAVWWAWNYTAWATNWIDPDRLAVRLLLIGLMLLSLVMSAAIPGAFGADGGAFAGAYVAIQVLRSAFMVWAFRGQVMGRNFAQLLAWSAIAGVAWIAGALVNGDARLVIWVIAVILDYGAPLVGYALPGVGRTPMTAWSLSPAHLAERCQLVVLIALGESVLVTGDGFAMLSHTSATVAAFIVTFGLSVALWWLYFARHAAAARERVESSSNPARLGRSGYAYAHGVMVAGVIVAAVGNELTLRHPHGDVSVAFGLTVLGGVALFNVGMVLFVLSTGGFDRFEQRMIAAFFGALIGLGLLSFALSPLELTTGALIALLGVVVAAAWHARLDDSNQVPRDAVVGELAP
jgi:low temperature requirement protein LtrA